jgi:NAD(P)H-dependent flavin oxidoreductase YrpB (nitropropane dioxygenase family)
MGIDHPIALAGMAGPTSPELVAAVTNAGGLGIRGVSDKTADLIPEAAEAVRRLTKGPFGLNQLLAFAEDDEIRAILDAHPAVYSTAWPRDNQDLKAIFKSAHESGVKVIHMVPTVADAVRAAEAGADVIIAQGTDGGGHIGLIGTVAIVPQVVSAVSPVPVLAAGGISDGRGLAAMLALGADGVLMGTRFLATPEAELADPFKKQILESDGTDTTVTDIGDIMIGGDWPGAYARVGRNRLIERWLGRAGEVRRRRNELRDLMSENRNRGDVQESLVYWGQGAGLIDEIVPAGKLVTDIVDQAEAILAERLPALVARKAPAH